MRKMLVGLITIITLSSSIANVVTASNLSVGGNNTTKLKFKQELSGDKVAKLKKRLKKVEKRFKVIKVTYSKKQRNFTKKARVYYKKRKTAKQRKLKRRYLSWAQTYVLKAQNNKVHYRKTSKRYVEQIRAIKAKIARLSNMPDIGVFLYEPNSELIPLEQKLGKEFKYFLWYQSLAEDFNAELARWLKDKGKTLELAWEPHNPSKSPSNQPEYSLKSIIQGEHDEDIYRWATQIKAFSHPVYFRPMSEMNGDWVAWGNTNGNSPNEYPVAWRHIHDIFTKVGANNAVWVWSPNRDGDLASAIQTYSQYYPGHQYVDVIGISGYNWGTMYNTPTWTSTWQTFSEVFYSSYKVYSSATTKPVMISETASTSVGGNKAAWIKDAFSQISIDYPRIKILVWFNVNKETDWRFDSSPSSLNAFRKYAF